MNIKSISKKPTSVCSIPAGCKGVHESTLRAYQILERVKGWLEKGVPADVILELIREIEEI